MSLKPVFSSKKNPCPVCDRVKDGDCRILESGNVILCHTHPADPGESLKGYRFLHPSKDQLWGVFVWGESKGKKMPKNRPYRQPYIYRDREGRNLVMAVRLTREDGKSFPQYHWDGVEWKKGLNDYQKVHVPIYRYQDVQTAIAQGKTIFMVEGEAKCDLLWDLGIPATTTLGGSKKYRAYGKYFEDLKDATLVLCPDRDKLGIEHMEDIALDFPQAKWCYVYPDSPVWRNLPKDGGLDVEDWIADGATAEAIANAITDKRDPNAKVDREKRTISKVDLIGRVRKLEEIESPVDRLFETWELHKLSGKGHRELIELAIALKSDIDLPDDEWAPTFKKFSEKQLLVDEWLFKGFLKAGRVTLLAAESKTGKSLLHYDWAYCLANGDSWGEFTSSKSRPVLIVQTDEPETDSQERIKARGLSELENGRIITKFMPQHMPRLKRLMATMGREGLLILDSLGSINRFGGYSPKDPEYGYFVYELKECASEMGWGIVVVTHTNKAPLEQGMDKIFGSQYIVAAASDILMLHRAPNAQDSDTVRLLRRVGGRNGAPKTWKLELNLEDYSYDYQGECGKDGGELVNQEPAQIKANGRQKILYFLQANAGSAFESREIAEHCGINSDRCRLLCGELFREELILRNPSARQSRAKAYYLPAVFVTNPQAIASSDRVAPHPITLSDRVEHSDIYGQSHPTDRVDEKTGNSLADAENSFLKQPAVEKTLLSEPTRSLGDSTVDESGISGRSVKVIGCPQPDHLGRSVGEIDLWC